MSANNKKNLVVSTEIEKNTRNFIDALICYCSTPLFIGITVDEGMVLKKFWEANYGSIDMEKAAAIIEKLDRDNLGNSLSVWSPINRARSCVESLHYLELRL